MRAILVFAFLLFQVSNAIAGTHRLNGVVKDSVGTLSAVSVSLLAPADSTLVAFGITDLAGRFEINNVNNGSYLLQVASLGYYTEYRPITVADGMNAALGDIKLEENKAAHVLNDVVISGERVPVRVKGDTLEYNASSFKVKPDGVVEDLLRKLPGIQVDKDGNIKSMGKDVKKVLVDGKEFFNDDPLLATKNLPADAIDKVQAFEKRSDGSLFTGIDDGSREQTLNLTLKKNKKLGCFGDVTAGAGSNGRYEGAIKAFRFRKTEQLAAMGMFNNINKFGFSIKDYLNFNGGLGSMMQSGGQININGDEVPIDNGQPISGAITSGAAAFNYTIEPRSQNRLTFSYMGNGIKKFLDQQTISQNYVPGSSFERVTNTWQNNNNLVNRLSLHWRNQLDSQNMYTLDVHGQIGSANAAGTAYTQTLAGGMPENYLSSYTKNNSLKTSADGTLNWIRKVNDHWPVFETRISAKYANWNERSEWNNITQFFSPAMQATDQQYLNNEQRTINTSAEVSAVRSFGKGFFLVPSVAGRFEKQCDYRTQGLLYGAEGPTDSLSPRFYRNAMTADAGLQLKRNRKNIQSYISLKAENISIAPYLNGSGLYNRNYYYLLPSAFFQKSTNGRSLSVNYYASVSAPQAAQMLPVADYSNPLMVTQGNVNLKPEYAHNLNGSYTIFDQFTMSSFFAMLNGSYVKDKIGWSQTVMPDLSQHMVMANNRYDCNARLDLQYARPVQKIGLNVSVGLTETWDQSIASINNVNNTNNTFVHSGKLSFNNLNNDKIDVRWGVRAEITHTSYSINKEQNANYYNYTGFIRCNYRPLAHWNISLACDVTHYTVQGVYQAVTIPICNAELTRYLMKNDRLSLNLRCFDILNQNRAIYQTSQLNYLLQQRSNIIGRYLMFSLGYKLNKVKGGAGLL
ncbi:outer membrane beta-barrel protein [Taibaiella soli]|uniref:Outer membrane protein beta-barrel domain-containing protein n=1 Tax=Taibaiella soli TaxID=1649169 RepID=A0A2W2BCU2_9BACT|nr:outer membrane beta-barrel protein [Taibaiella soli]PZF74049.1 hypothetical protein DN068_04980 [Taibaiella soli]